METEMDGKVRSMKSQDTPAAALMRHRLDKKDGAALCHSPPDAWAPSTLTRPLRGAGTCRRSNRPRSDGPGLMGTQENLKINILLLLFNSPQGIPLSQLTEAYLHFHGHPLNPLVHGYPSISALLQDLHGMVDIQTTGPCTPRLQIRVPGSQGLPIPRQGSPGPGVGLRPSLSLPPRLPANLGPSLFLYPPPRHSFGLYTLPVHKPFETDLWPSLSREGRNQPKGAGGGGKRMGPDVPCLGGQAEGEASVPGPEAPPMTYSQVLRSSTIPGKGVGSRTGRGEKEARGEIASNPTGKPRQTRQKMESNRGICLGQIGKEGAVGRHKQGEIASNPTGKPRQTRQKMESNRGICLGEIGKEGAVGRHKQDPNPPDPREAVRHLLDLHPDGLSLFQLRQKYQHEYGHPLDSAGRPNLRALLREMVDIVSIQGHGVQERVFPQNPSRTSSRGNITL
ncbi:uncharacterized protein [Narcine bancroftii]|uniref:uncharacterized protein n=1 Tax=Narcine bancroftii TaxID=1343680 RepID=UPI003831035F